MPNNIQSDKKCLQFVLFDFCRHDYFLHIFTFPFNDAYGVGRRVRDIEYPYHKGFTPGFDDQTTNWFPRTNFCLSDLTIRTEL